MLSLISAKWSQIKNYSCQYCPKPHFSGAFSNFWRALYNCIYILQALSGCHFNRRCNLLLSIYQWVTSTDLLKLLPKICIGWQYKEVKMHIAWVKHTMPKVRGDQRCRSKVNLKYNTHIFGQNTWPEGCMSETDISRIASMFSQLSFWNNN